jgi:hypothetical protein
MVSSPVLQDLDPRVIEIVGIIYRPVFSSGRVPQEESRKCMNRFSMEVKENWSRFPDVGLIPRQTGRLTVIRKIALTGFAWGLC